MTDWKEVASSYYDKCLAITILFVLFSVLVFPKLEVQKIQRIERATEAIVIPDEIRDEIKPPEEAARPAVQIEIVDDSGPNAESGDVETIDTIEDTKLKPYIENAAPTMTNENEGKTPKFVAYEEAPVLLKLIQPEYPPFAKKSGIQGQVIVEVEVLASGNVGAIEIRKSLMSGPGGLDEAARKAVKQWKYQPAKSGGKAVSVWVTFPVDFSLEK